MLKQGLPHLYKFPDYQWASEYWDTDNRMRFLTAANQVSKMLDSDCLIPTPSGYKKMRDIEIGDHVFGRDGEPTKVVGIPFIGEDLCYEITFDDGDKVIASKDHEWICMGPTERFRKVYTSNGRKWDNPTYQKWQVKSTQEIFDHAYDCEITKAPKRYVIPMCDPVQYGEKDLLIEPYLLGVMIGDGCLGHRSPTLTINENDQPLLEYLKEFTQRYEKKKHCYTVRLKGYKKKISSLSLDVNSKDKFIPSQYLVASVEQRRLLLAGLMDTDGTVNNYGNASTYSTVSPQLATDVKELVNSLGGMAEIKRYKAGYKKDGVYKRCNDVYEVSVYLESNPFRFSARKAAKWKIPGRYDHQRVIYSIKSVGKRTSKCITVDNSDGSFLCTKDFIVTHNSSTAIIDNIKKACEVELWHRFFYRGAARRAPRVFWYLYPDNNKIEDEFLQHWEGEFLPQEPYRSRHPLYGWERETRKGKTHAIHFKSKVSVYFKSWYVDLQAATVDMLTFDEEPPVGIIDECVNRLGATDGMLAAVFTATKCQEYFFDIMEERGKKKERFPGAWKRQISLFDCQKYADGSPGPWTTERINRRINACSDQRDVDIRIHGRILKPTSSLKYSSFRRERNVVPPAKWDPTWHLYAGIDLGSGGKDNHPAAICFIAVRPDYKKAKVVRSWRGDPDKVLKWREESGHPGGDETSNGDILRKFLEMKLEMELRGFKFFGINYDWAAKDFEIQATAVGLPVEKAEKSHDIGEGLLNTSFKNQILDIEDNEENQDLIREIEGLRNDIDKKKAKDDAIDGMRYAYSKVPMDYSVIEGAEVIILDKVVKDETDERAQNAESMNSYDPTKDIDVEQEIEFWNDIQEEY